MQLELSGIWLESVVSFIVWLVANVVYLDMKRSGARGIRRFFAFWLGSPTTWITLLFVREGSALRLEPPPDDEEALLAEIRRDRRLRGGDDTPSSPPSAPSDMEES